ncbi:hypothetical protein [Kitasatospora sp. NPDC047058]|uniref:hypothetical protein n=1 Tax=Kitasatospora sp. NPDC047058 TaxID=3155620 RepID=UPI0033D873CC
MRCRTQRLAATPITVESNLQNAAINRDAETLRKVKATLDDEAPRLKELFDRDWGVGS